MIDEKLSQKAMAGSFMSAIQERINARILIDNRIKNLREEAYRLESLLREMPSLSTDADAALFTILVSGFRS